MPATHASGPVAPRSSSHSEAPSRGIVEHLRRGAPLRVPVLSTIPTLLVTGEFDPITPPEWGERVDNALPNSRLVAARGQGHDPLSGLGDCGSSLLEAFVTDPAALVDGTCAQQPIDFLVPADLEDGDPQQGVRICAVASSVDPGRGSPRPGLACGRRRPD